MAYSGENWVQSELRELGSEIQLEFSDSVLNSKFLIILIFANMSSRNIYVPSPNIQYHHCTYTYHITSAYSPYQ